METIALKFEGKNPQKSQFTDSLISEPTIELNRDCGTVDMPVHLIIACFALTFNHQKKIKSHTNYLQNM